MSDSSLFRQGTFEVMNGVYLCLLLEEHLFLQKEKMIDMYEL